MFSKYSMFRRAPAELGAEGSSSRIGVKLKHPKILSIVAILIVVCVIYMLVDASIMTKEYLSRYDVAAATRTKEAFKVAFVAATQADMVQARAAYDFSEYAGDINIDSTIFSELTIALNTQIYSITASIFNKDHLNQYHPDWVARTEPESVAMTELINPLIPMAIAIPEMGDSNHTRYDLTWIPAIYSRPLADAIEAAGVGFDINMVDSQTFITMGNEYKKYAACGRGTWCCQNTKPMHVASPLHQWSLDSNNETYGNRDSLGPLQILRQYMEDADGNTVTRSFHEGDDLYNVTDLMNWHDTLVYEFEAFLAKFYGSVSGVASHNEGYNVYQLAAMFGSMHNRGSATYTEFCYQLGKEEHIAIIAPYIDDWVEKYKEAYKSGDAASTYLPGNDSFFGNELGMSGIDFIQNVLGIDTSIYGGDNAAYTYPLKVILGYMTLERLYYSGGSVTTQ